MEEHPLMRFGPEQIATFAPIIPTLEAFAEEHGLEVSRLFDKDPVMPDACYFFSWPRCFIRVSASDPFAVVDSFDIVVCGPRRGFKNKWHYATFEGNERLDAVLQEAKAMSDREALSPEEEVALEARLKEQRARVQEMMTAQAQRRREAAQDKNNDTTG